MKRFLLLVLALLLLLPLAACGAPAGNDAPADTDAAPADTAAEIAAFAPVARFVFASDVHVGDTHSPGISRLADMMEQLYNYAAGQSYDKLDALILTGDETNGGDSEDAALVDGALKAALREGTQLLLCLGNHDVTDDGDMEAFAALMGGHAQTDTVLNGIPFVGISAPTGSPDDYTGMSGEIEARLAAAAEQAHDGPIFVFNHFPTDSSEAFSTALEKYPNVISIYGHTHLSVRRAGALKQNVITSLDIGTLGRSAEGVNEEYDYSEAPCVLAEVDADGSVLLRAYDVAHSCFFTRPDGSELCWYIARPGDTATYLYRNMDGVAPSLADLDLRIESVTDRGAIVSFKTAVDESRIASYTYTVNEAESGALRTTGKIRCAYDLEPEPARRSFLIPNIAPGTTCELRISAKDVRGNESGEMTAILTVPEKSIPARRISGDGLFTDFENRSTFATGGDLVFRAQLPADYVTLGRGDHRNMLTDRELSLVEHGDSTMLEVQAGYADDMEFQLFATTENGIPNSYPGAKYLCVRADFSGVEFTGATIGLISADGTKYRLRAGADMIFYYRPDGSDTWQELAAGSAAVLGRFGACRVQGLSGDFAFPLSEMRVDSETNYAGAAEETTPDVTDVSGIFFEWKYCARDPEIATGTPFWMDDFSLTADYTTLA